MKIIISKKNDGKLYSKDYDLSIFANNHNKIFLLFYMFHQGRKPGAFFESYEFLWASFLMHLRTTKK